MNQTRTTGHRSRRRVVRGRIAGQPDLHQPRGATAVEDVLTAAIEQDVVAFSQHDSYGVGDNFHLPNQPDVVIISENKDTAVRFHRMSGGIAVEGAGTGGGTIASTPWTREAPVVI